LGTLSSQFYSILFIHYGSQCPWIPWMRKQVKQAAKSLKIKLRIINLMKNPHAASDNRIYFPFVTIINQHQRIHAPISSSKLIQIITQGLKDKWDRHTELLQAEATYIEPINSQNIKQTCQVCIPQVQNIQPLAKMQWALRISQSVKNNLLGYIAYNHHHTPVGAIEILPSSLVPYPIPYKSYQHAFITCLYSFSVSHVLDKGVDYRAHLLKHAFHHLPTYGYDTIQIVAGKTRAFPNGPASFLVKQGFKIAKHLQTIKLADGTEDIIFLEYDLL